MDFDKAVAELDALVATLEREGDERGLLLLQLVDAIHRPALELIARGELDHPIARALLAMYDLAELDERTQVEEALDEVRPYIHSHGGEVELLEVEGGIVRLRLTGSCVGCAGSAMTLRRGIEEALRAGFPGFRELVGDEAEPHPQLVQIESLRRPIFVEAGAVPSDLRGVDVDGVNVLLVNVGGEVYAFRNECALDGLALDGGHLADNILVCPWHNCAYDARTGKRVDDSSEPGLAVVPVALEDDSVRVAVNVA